MLREDENGKGYVWMRTYLQEEQRADYSLEGASKICHRRMNVTRKSEGVVTIQRCFHSIAGGEIIFSKE